MVRLALIEDDTDLRAALTGMLARAGYTAEVFESAEDFLGSDSVSTFDLVVSEFPMEGSEGAEVLKACRAVPDPPAVLLVTGRGSVVEALEAGEIREMPELAEAGPVPGAGVLDLGTRQQGW